MACGKKQLRRMLKFVAMLKENRYPNCKSFVKRLQDEDYYESKDMQCTEKTIHRDIVALKKEFDAPIEYDYYRHGYYLSNHGWDFPCPPVFDEHEMLASVLGARISEDIFPEPLRTSIRKSVDFQLTTNNPDFLDSAILDALVISSGLNVSINPDVFNCIFEAWKTHKAVLISYVSASEKKSSRLIEPHVLAFKDSAWFIRAYCLKENATRTFALHRMETAEMTDKTFVPDHEIIRSVGDCGPFEYDEIRNVTIRCDETVKRFVTERPVHKTQKLEKLSGGEYLITIESIWEEELIRWLLQQAGRAVILSPRETARKVKAAANKILSAHS